MPISPKRSWPDGAPPRTPALPRRRGRRAQVRGWGAHLLNGQGGLVLGALGDLVQHGAELQAVEGHLELVLVEAQGVQEHGLLQVRHGGLQPALILLNVRHLHVHLATEQDHEAGGTDSITRAQPGCRGTPPGAWLSSPAFCPAFPQGPTEDQEEVPADHRRPQSPLVRQGRGAAAGPSRAPRYRDRL